MVSGAPSTAEGDGDRQPLRGKAGMQDRQNRHLTSTTSHPCKDDTGILTLLIISYSAFNGVCGSVEERVKEVRLHWIG